MIIYEHQPMWSLDIHQSDASVKTSNITLQNTTSRGLQQAMEVNVSNMESKIRQIMMDMPGEAVSSLDQGQHKNGWMAQAEDISGSNNANKTNVDSHSIIENVRDVSSIIHDGGKAAIIFSITEGGTHALKLTRAAKRAVSLKKQDVITRHDCHSSKPCLEKKFVPLAVNISMESNPQFWNFWLQDNHYIVNYSLPIISCITHGKTLVIYVHSNAAYANRRQFIRQTWGSVTEYEGIHVSVVFMLGLTGNQSIDDEVAHESQVYNDIVRGDFLENYRNMTRKIHMGVHWIYHHCSKSSYVLKMDDDVFVNIYSVIYMVKTVVSVIHLPVLFCSGFAASSKPFRAPAKNKWVLTREEYPQAAFPPMCAGRAFISRTETTMRLSVLASHVKHIWVDDLWLTGIVGRVAGMKYVVLPFKDLDAVSTGGKQACFYNANMYKVKAEQQYNDAWKKLKSRNGAMSSHEIPCM